MTKKIVAFDLGTGGNKASLFDGDGALLASAFVPYSTDCPASGFHEQRPCDWYAATVESARRLLAETGVSGRDVRALAISGQSLSTVPLDREGRLLRESVPIWSDSRATEQAARFFESVDPLDWYRTTGNGFPPGLYTVFKLLWFRENEPEMFRKIDRVLGSKDYVNFRLTGRAMTDRSYASGCGVYNLLSGEYDDALLAATGLDRGILPEIFPSTEVVGTLTGAAAAELGLTTETAVVCGGVDNACMPLGAGCHRAGRAYASLGSSSWIAVTDDRPTLDDRSKPYVFAHVVPGLFTSAIGMFASGTAFRWVRDRLCPDLIERAAAERRDVYDLMTELAAFSPPGANGLLMNPSLSGGSSIDPSPAIRGAFLGLDLAQSRSDLIRAAMEGIAFGTRTLLETIRSLARVDGRLTIVGGGGNSPFWCGMYADILKTPLEKTPIGQNAASLGAAAVAAVGVGLWDSFDRLDDLLTGGEIFAPDSDAARFYDDVYARYQNAVGLLARFAEEK